MNKTFVALDTETTGLRSSDDAIIEVAAVKFRGAQVLDTWSSLVNPGRAVPLKVTRLTGITPEQLHSAPRIEQVARHIARFVGEHPVVGHNVEFDLAFLRQQKLLLNNPRVDTDELARIVMPHASRFSLKQLAEELEISLPESHRALADAQTTRALFLALCERAAQLDAHVLDEIVKASEKSNWGLRDVFKELQRGAGRNAFAGSSIGEQLRAKGLIRNNRLTLLDRDEEPPALQPVEHAQSLDPDALEALFEPGGALAEHFPGYELRPQQVQMMRAVCDTFNQGGQVLIEAGTGTGKSMAYLVPAIQYAVLNERRIVISTNTINLQDQLIEKDIPDLRKIMPQDFRAIVMKGRSNYLCRHRWERFQQKPNKGPSEVRLLAKVLAWLSTTTTGDRAELSIAQDEEAAWAQVCADETCNAQSCPYYQKGTCFFFRSRKRADSAHLLVVNHALLLSDMAVGNQVLPEYTHLIVDEAHHLEARATEAFSVEVRQSAIEELLSQVSRDRGGILPALASGIRATRAGTAELDKIGDLIEGAAGSVGEAERALYPLFNHLSDFLHGQHPQRGEYDQHVRLVASLRAQPAWSTSEILCDALTAALGRLATLLGRIAQACDDSDLLVGDDRLFTLGVLQQRVEQLRGNLAALICEPSPNGIYWASLNPSRDEIALRSAPLHVGEMLKKGLYAAPRESIVLTSATLRSSNQFGYIRERLGLPDATELALDSPFDYKRSTLLCIPSDVPEPDTPNYNTVLRDTLIDVCTATQGRTLVLFTSKSQLQRTYEAISKPLEQAGILVLGQYMDGSRRQLLDNFRTMPRTVLLGTRSFWEGVDVVGAALSCLVITRLPFAVPSDPIIAARSETFEDAFNEYSVPQAVLAFRQGFGRLIRSAGDRGVVVLLDRRVQSKAYGRLFVTALPTCSERRVPCKEVPAAAAEWLG